MDEVHRYFKCKYPLDARFLTSVGRRFINFVDIRTPKSICRIVTFMSSSI